MRLYDFLMQAGDRVPFHMPGHLRDADRFDWLCGLAPFDFTEIDGLDDLHAPEGILREAELYVRVFGHDWYDCGFDGREGQLSGAGVRALCLAGEYLHAAARAFAEGEGVELLLEHAERAEFKGAVLLVSAALHRETGEGAAFLRALRKVWRQALLQQEPAPVANVGEVQGERLAVGIREMGLDRGRRRLAEQAGAKNEE